MAQRQFKSTDTSPWVPAFGNGSDGAYAPSTGTDAPVDSACTGTINTNSLSATNASFSPGQLILIHQTYGAGAGQWELNKISGYTAGTITTSYNLIYGYVTGAQVIVIPQYSSANISIGNTITCKAWNGTVGGIYVKASKSSFTVAGSIVSSGGNGSTAGGTVAGGSGGGSRGGNGVQNNVGTQQSQQGDGTSANGGTSTAANGTGGGGALGNRNPFKSCSGGGGGHASSGSNGGTQGDGTGTAGTGGGTGGEASLVTMIFGGGGGGAAIADNGNTGSGGAGGGIVFIIGKTITVSGSILSNGGNGGTGGDAGGSAGAGGSVLLKGQSIVLGSSLVTATAGTAGTGGRVNGAASSVGRIHADYRDSLTGTTSPALDSTQDATLSESSGGFFNLNFA